MSEIKTKPVQTPRHRTNEGGRCPESVVMRAYEVYSAVYGPQEAIVTGGCRGGFSTGELIAFLYAYSFPRGEWRHRVNQAFEGMANL